MAMTRANMSKQTTRSKKDLTGDGKVTQKDILNRSWGKRI